MYQAIYYDRKTKLYYLRDDIFGWKKEFKYQPTFYKPDPQGQYLTLFGDKVSPTKTYSDDCLEKDVDKDTRVLVDLYSESDDTPSYHNTVFFDIECEIAGALTPQTVANAPTKITSIALYDVNTKQYYCYILDENQLLESYQKDNTFIISCVSEKILLLAFLDKWNEIDPTIISGWNSEFFDVPYTYNRIVNVFDDGGVTASRLSPIGKIYIDDESDECPIQIGGINHLDYMLLFKKYVTKQEPSYALGNIGTKYVKLGKIEYYGSLDKLFKEDVQKFIEYNIRDVEILVKLEEKLKFIDLTVTVCHLCHTTYKTIYFSTTLNDGAILTYLKRKNIASPNKPTTSNKQLAGLSRKKAEFNYQNSDKKEEAKKEYDRIIELSEYAGGYLKEPEPGLYEWVIDLDFTSLYPSIIRSLNIGIETLVGRIQNKHKTDNQWSLDELKGMDPNTPVIVEKLLPDKTIKETQTTAGIMYNFVKNNNLIISAPGVIFDKNKQSVVCEILTDWFNKRVEYKNLMKKAYKAGDTAMGEFYNRRQHAYKIKLNDVYGVFALNSWRYTDGHKMISKAITLTGQRLTQESIIFCNKIMNERLGTNNKDYIITSDTDSLFIHVKDLLRAEGVDLTDKAACIAATLELATEIQSLANKHLDTLIVDLFNLHDRPHYFELKQEVVIERGYFSGKRRYAMYIVNKEGVTVEELDMKGLDLMKSNFPPLFREFGESILNQIMFGKQKQDIDKQILEFKTKVNTIDWRQLLKPTGLKQLGSYIDSRPRNGEIFSKLRLKCPINTKAAIRYNDLLQFKGLDKQYSKFQIGDKMLIAYLKDNPFKIDCIGFNGYNDPPQIIEFIEKYINRGLLFDSVMKNKIEGLYSDIGWGMPIFNANFNKFFTFD
jgi:DNA polymerase elongation subunit (family B)